MALFLLYIIKSSICLTLFYLFYILVMRGSTFFRFNRLTLLLGTIVCMLLPFFSITVSEEQLVQIPMQTLSEVLIGETEQTALSAQNALGQAQETVTKEASPVVHCTPALFIGAIYIIGMTITFSFIAVSFFRMWQLIRLSPRKRENGYWLIITPQPIHSFSWGKYIVLSEDDYRKSPMILTHEQMHLRCHHTLDLLCFTFITLLHWFNPMVWLTRLELQQLHEFEADEEVIKQGINATQYQLLLVKKAVGTRLYSMANGFNHSKLKNRITMMLKERTNGWARLKLLMVAPVVMGAMFVFARPEVKVTLEEMVPATRQSSNQPQDLLAMKNFFSQEMKKSNVTPEKARAEGMHKLYINQRNQILFDEEKNITQDEIRKTLTETFINTAYNHKKKTGKDLIQSLSITYDIHASEFVIYKYLCEIKVALESLPQLASQMELDNSKEKWPIIVFFEKPKSFSKEAQTRKFTDIEVTLSNNEKAIKLKDFTENDLKDAFINLNVTTVGLKMTRNVGMEEITRLKALLRLLYTNEVNLTETTLD